MDEELKQHLDRIESKLDELLRGRSGKSVSGSKVKTETKSAKESTTGIPDPKGNPLEYNEAMKKYDTPDGNKQK
jgi:hypothetical protein